MSGIVTVCWNLEWMHGKSLLKDKRVFMTSLANTRLLKVGYWWEILYIWSPLFLKPCLPKYQLHLSATCKDHCKCSNLNGCHHSIPFQSDLKKGIPDQSGITKATKQLSVQFHFKMLWGKKKSGEKSLDETIYSLWNF